jgi:anti-sigma factor (TIGR02949 family)
VRFPDLRESWTPAGVSKRCERELDGASSMNCRELIGVILEYLEGEMTPADVEEFEAHLAKCAPCRAYLATYRKTKDLAADVGRIEMPEEMKERLREFLLRRLPRSSPAS